MISPSVREPHRSWLLPVALGVLGAALRLWQYAAGASLWADEANLALNIVDRPLGRLLGPLDYRQMAPPGWLLLQKAAVTLFGDGEHALRLIPLLGSLATLPLAWHVARRILRPGVEPALALGLVATAVPLIFFAAQVKPYATDVAAALLLLALALAVRRAGPGGGRLLRLGLAGTLLPWLSYPALLVERRTPGGPGRDGDPRARPGAPPVARPGRPRVGGERRRRDRLGARHPRARRRRVPAAVLGPLAHAACRRAVSRTSAGPWPD